MMKPDLSAFKKNYQADTPEGLEEVTKSNKQFSQPIGVGIHEVVVSKIHVGKDGLKFKLDDKLGGSISAGLWVTNTAKQEQYVNFSIPLAVTYNQACKDENKGIQYMFKRSLQILHAMQLDPRIVREAVLFTDCDALDYFLGVQFIIENFWSLKSIHLEYDYQSKASFFANAMGERFTFGELAGPHHVDKNLAYADRFKHFEFIAKEHGYVFKNNPDTEYRVLDTVTNAPIMDKFFKACVPKQQKSEFKIVNKTIPPTFPSQSPLKRVTSPLDTVD